MSVLTLNVDEVMRTLSAESSNPFVVHDKEVDIVRFAINSGFADIVLDGQVALRVMYQRPGETEVRAQTLTYYDTDGLHNYYDWQLAQSDLAKNGLLMVALCILDISGGEVSEWHTTPCAVRVLPTIHTDDSDEGDDTITPTVKERVAVLESMIQRVASGAPIVVASTSAMTDTDQIYVLSTDGKWYYHNGSSWVAGGEYGAVATDTTLTQANVPADAKVVGDAIADTAAVGDALKDNLDDIHIPLGVNLYDYNNIAYDLGIDGTTGAESYTRLYNSCDFIAVDPNTNYIIKSFEYSGNASHRIYEYDVTKTFIRRRVKAISADHDGWVITTHENSAYIRLSFESENNTSATQNEKKIVFAKGLSSVTEYIPYYTAYDRVARLLDSKKLDIPSTERFLSCDLNDISTNGIYGLDSSQTYEHAPAGIRAGLFVCLVAHTTIFQFVQAFSANKRYYRRRIATGEFSNWMLTDGDAISGEGYRLDSTGTTADVTSNIESLLAQYGICHLGPGDFYVSGIDMPENSMLCGCGSATRVILLGTHSDSGYAIKLNHRCEIRDMTISGSAVDRTYADVSSDIIQRHGILFEANAYNGSSADSNSFVDKCNLSNLWIKNFTGGGITANNTGYGVQSCMNVNNVYTFLCNIGINIAFFSEFHRFTNCQAWCCYYGVINNGGNNIFAACSFGRNRLGFLMDNSSGTMRNNSHGTITGCAFVHSDLNALYDNAGVGLKLVGLQYGQIISNCQVGLSDIVVENCKGIQFSNINVASRCNIRVSKGDSGGLVMFNDMIAVSPDTFTLSVDEGYTLCKFNNCWDVNGNSITA